MEVNKVYKYLVTYDLNTPGKNYYSLINKIKSYSYAKVCESTWIIRSNSNAVQLRDELRHLLDSNDRLFVSKLTGEAAWYNCIDTDNNIKKVLL